MSESLFALPSDAYKVTSDDCYTPRWVFDAMGLKFDLDVAAPPGGPWHVPAERYYTAEDDGLAQPWDGLVWCNPPYSNYRPWADRFARHDRMALMGICLPEVHWFPITFAAAEDRTAARSGCASRCSSPSGVSGPSLPNASLLPTSTALSSTGRRLHSTLRAIEQRLVLRFCHADFYGTARPKT